MLVGDEGGPALARQAGVVALTTVGVSIANYAWALLLVRLLPPGDYGRFASAQGLLLVLGSGSAAAVPWAVARHVSLHRTAAAAREALFFGVTAGAVQGAAFAVVAGAVLTRIGGWHLGLATAAAAFGLSAVAAPVGFLQGEQRLRRIAAVRTAEVLTRTIAGTVAVVMLSARTVAAVSAFSVGSVVAAAFALASCRRGLPLRRASTAVLRQLGREGLRLGAVQVLLVMLAALDTVVIQFVGASGTAVADYEVAAVLGRVPFFLSGAVALAYYRPLVRAADDAGTARVLRAAVRGYLTLAVPTVLLLISVPPRLLGPAAPRDTDGVGRLLVGTALSGLALGLVNVITTAHQARGRFRSALAVLVPAALLQPVLLVLAGRSGGVDAFATVLAVSSLLAGVAIVLAGRQWWPWLRLGRPLVAATAVGGGTALASLWLRTAAGPSILQGSLWALAAAVLLPTAAAVLRAAGPRTGPPAVPVAQAADLTPLAAVLRRMAPRAGRPVVGALIVGNYGNGNTGDEAILAGLLEQLPAGVRPTVVSRHPERVTALHGVNAVPTVSTASFRAFVGCRAVVIGGGGMFGAGLPPLVGLLPLAALGARLLAKQTFFAAIGAYADTPQPVLAMLRLSSRVATAVTVRDVASQEVMSSGIARGTVATVVGDPAEVLRPRPFADVHALLRSGPADPAPVVVSLKAMPDSGQLAEVCRVVGLALRAEVARTGVDPVFLCLSDQGDYGLGTASSDEVLARRVIADHLGGRGRVVGPHLDPRLAKAVVGAAGCVLAMRLHAQVFASSQRVPILGLVFEPKARAWLSATGGAAVEATEADPAVVAGWLAAAQQSSARRHARAVAVGAAP